MTKVVEEIKKLNIKDNQYIIETSTQYNLPKITIVLDKYMFIVTEVNDDFKEDYKEDTKLDCDLIFSSFFNRKYIGSGIETIEDFITIFNTTINDYPDGLNSKK